MNSNQLDLFTIGNISQTDFGVENDKYDYPDIPEFSAKEKLRQEKEYNGMYFSGHPLDDYKEYTEKGNFSSIGDILSSFSEEGIDTGSFSDKQKVDICGIITSKTVKPTKNSDSMAFAVLEDRTGEIELVIFPKVYSSNAHLVMKDTPVCVRGTISAEEGKAPKILVFEIKFITDILNSSAEINPAEKPKYKNQNEQQATAKRPETIYLKINEMSGETFDKIINIISIFEGTTKVIFYDATRKKYEKYSRAVDIRPNMLAYLKELLGDDCVVLK